MAKEKTKNGAVLITGAAGFVGYHLAAHYRRLGNVVVGVDKVRDDFCGGDAEHIKRVRGDLLLKEGVVMEEGDLAEYETAEFIFAKYRPSLVFHLAAKSGARDTDEQQMGENNVTAFVNILSAADKNPPAHFLFASSSSVYGEHSPRPFCEKTPLSTPDSCYAASKFAGELAARIWSKNAAFPITGMRFFNIYGPWGRPDMAPFVFADCLSRGREIPVISGDTKRPWLYIDDAVAVCEKLAKIPPSEFRVVNIAGPGLVRTMDLLVFIAGLLGENPVICRQPPMFPEVTSNPADLKLLRSLVGGVPQTAFVEGAKKFIQWHSREWMPMQIAERA